MRVEDVIRILEVAELSSEQARKILEYCTETFIDEEGEVWVRLPLPKKLKRWLEIRAGRGFSYE